MEWLVEAGAVVLVGWWLSRSSGEAKMPSGVLTVVT